MAILTFKDESEYPSDRWPHFSYKEMACKCGKCKNKLKLDEEFMDSLSKLRHEIKHPLVVNSGYRCKLHPIEKVKSTPGAHQFGMAADIRYYDTQELFFIVSYAFEMGFTGIGIGETYVHLDIVNVEEPSAAHLFRPLMWRYK